MLSFVATPIAAYRPLEHRHKWLMQVMVSFADRSGKCWPSLRVIADQAGAALSWVQRNLEEMERLGYFSRRRRGRGSYLYRIAERFLPAVRPRDKAGSDATSFNTRSRDAESPQPAPRFVDTPKTRVPPVATEGESGKENQLDLKSKGGSLRRYAPPSDGPNPFARRQWLVRLNAFISERLRGPQQWSAWELIAKAEAGEVLGRDDKRTLDQIDRQMRGCGYRPGA